MGKGDEGEMESTHVTRTVVLIGVLSTRGDFQPKKRLVGSLPASNQLPEHAAGSWI